MALLAYLAVEESRQPRGKLANSVLAQEQPLAVLDEAQGHAMATHALYKEISNRAMEVDSLCVAGSVEIHKGRPQEVIPILRKARAASIEIDNLWEQANTGHMLALASLEVGDYGALLTLAQESVAVAQATDSTTLIGGTLTIRGIVYRTLLNTEMALTNHQFGYHHSTISR